METETLTFMPNGDVTLQLVRRIGQPSESLIKKNPLNESENAPAEEEEEAPEDDNVLWFAPDPPETEHTANIFSPPVRGRRDTDLSSIRERSTSPPPGFWARLKKDPVVILPENQDVNCVVSSGHMMLASAYFQKRLTGEYTDAVTLRNTGRATISLNNDPDTLIILLNIIHGRTRQVPRSVSLDLLSRLAVLINYYAMLESVELFSDTWIENLKREGMPTEYNEHVLPWLFIFWVFEKGDDFRDMARLVQRECGERLDELVGITPLPHTMINAMKNGRQIAIDTAISAIDQLITKYMDGKVNCTHDGESLRYSCDAMVLGSLMKGARTIGIWPKPAAPFPGKILRKLLEEIRSIKVLDVCSQQVDASGIRYPASNCHGIEDSIKATMKIIEDGLDDLELDDYKKNSEQLWDEFPINPPTPVKKEDEPSITKSQAVEETSLESHQEPEPKEFEIEDDIDELVKEFSSEIKIERRSSDDSFKSLPSEDVKARPFEQEPVSNDTKENYSNRNSYSIPRKDVNSKSFEREVRQEEVKEDYAVQPATYRRDATIESPKSRPVLEELKQGYEVEQNVKSPHQKDTWTDSRGGRPVLVQVKEDRPVEQAPTASYRKDARPESFDRRGPVIVDSRTGHEPATKTPYRNGVAIESPTEHTVVEEVKRGYAPEQIQKCPFQKETRAESPRGSPAPEDVKKNHASEQSRESTPRREVKPDTFPRSPVLEDMKEDHTIAQSWKQPFRNNVKPETSDRRSPVIEEVKGNYPVEPTLKASFRQDESPRRREVLEEARGHAPEQVQKSPSHNMARKESPRNSPVLEETKNKYTPSQAPKAPVRNDPKPEPSDRRSPVSEATKKVYSFEQNLSEPPVEGVKVTDNWRGSSIVEDQKPTPEEVKISPKEEVQITTNNISANEDNDLFIPPMTFKVRKSKKRFATRF